MSRPTTWMLLATMSACSCGDDDGVTPPSRGDAAQAASDARRPNLERCRVALPLDMIWVIDNSNSMGEEQANLAENFPIFIERLTTPPDDDDDGMPDYPAVTDLRIAIVTTDLGVGDNPGIIGCPSATGDEGRFISESRAEGACSEFALNGPPWLTFMTGGDTAQFSGDFACLSTLGTDGCGLEQQLEASRRAVVENAAPGQPGEGFLRSDSLVTVVYVTDEDDCSAADEGIFANTPEAMAELGPFRTRCAFHPEFLHPTRRYVEALRNLALDRRGDVIVAAITGVPRELTQDPANVDFDAVLADDRMQFRPDPDDETDLAAACEFGGVGRAPPARRIIEVVQEFGQTGDGVLASICEPDLGPVMEAIATLVGERLCDAPI